MKSVVDPTVQILLQIGERVISVSPEHHVIEEWNRNSFKEKTDNILKDNDETFISSRYIVNHCSSSVSTAFTKGLSGYTEITFFDGIGLLEYGIRVLPYPTANIVFLVVERTKAVEGFQQIEDKWKLALDASGDGVWDIDIVAGTIIFSEKWQEMFGYSSSEITTIQDWADKIFPEDITAAEKSIKKYLASETPNYTVEVRYKCKNGSYKWILSRGIVIARQEDGTPTRFIGVHTDIHKRKLEEDELRVNKETFSNSFNYSGTGKALLSPGGQWLEVNDVLCRMTEYSKDELLNLHYRDITYPDDIDIDLALIGQLLNKEIPAYSIEKRYVTRSRKIVATLLTVTLVFDNADIPKYFICDVVDITSHKELSNQLLRKNMELETTSESLGNKIKQLENLNHIVAHNLRGPVSNIKFLSEESEVFKEGEALKWISECSDKLISELDFLLELSQIKLNTEITKDDCVIGEIVNGISLQLQGTIYEKNAKIFLDLAVPTIQYPRIYLESILYNLISNALKYSKKEGQPAITITTCMSKGKISLSVRDNGLGIDMVKHKDQVFKLNQVFHEGYDSKGVGLFITKTQIEALGGNILVKSKPDEGSEFIVTF
ncbi:hypothetical protein CJD36_017730 [Flavipsychrobacter stenotrophus]|uniref:histidine kinase n=1 Tax=Flavipsychrobacter stenotrophus TaxID=2077091 RepID=A0A2S7SST9_9BACT|nr:PAS domain-containing sensor histidine kinase [Flavipsychrobacter stenotrophus]PQJ09768.1 hypothetical protein CJD36_017730 [Flavipsychrobacter stenotrophus]